MIRATIKTQSNVLPGLSNYAARFNQRVAEIGERAFGALEDVTLDTLRDYPPPPPNSTYVRTYTLRNGWHASITRESGGFAVVFENDTSYAKYVVGSLAQARAVAAKAQAWMHKGRWPLAADTLQAFQDLYLESVNAEIAKDLANYGRVTTSRRAFTR